MKSDIKNNPAISFIFLIYNGESLISETLNCVKKAINKAEWYEAEIVFVDDGSTDKTVEKLKDFEKDCPIPIRLIQQKNMGRLYARRKGLSVATGDYVLFVDARVRLHEDSLKYIKQQLISHPERTVWNAHIEIPRKGISQAGFWYVVTYIAWRRYLAKPKYISFGIDTFDYYPKGTGAFFVPRNLVIEAYANLDSIYDNAKFASDDTTMMRNIAKKQNINISPEYAADYIARTDLKSFVKHAYDRGTFLLDSYMRKGTRLYYAVLAYFPISLASITLLLLFPLQILGIVIIGYTIVAIFLGLAARIRADDIASFLVLAPLFTVVYSVGIWRGLFALMHQKLGTGTDA